MLYLIIKSYFKEDIIMNEKELEMQLLDNPKYSSTWVQNAAQLIAKCGLIEEELVKFDAEQLQMLVAMFTAAQEQENKTIWINGFLNPELNASQMQVLLTGYTHGLTTDQLKPYFNPEIPYVKSNWAITALVEGFDIADYIDDYNKDQIYEIYAGLKDGIDISLYNKADIPAEKMAIVRHALVLGLNPQFDENKNLTI
jgi:hypothetical protein